MKKTNLGQKLKELRKKHGYTQRKIASLLDIPRSSYANYESGKTDMSYSVMQKLIRTYGVDANYLLDTRGIVLAEYLLEAGKRIGDEKQKDKYWQFMYEQSNLFMEVFNEEDG